MKMRKTVLIFPILLLVLTVIAFIFSPLRYIFPLAGIIIMIGAYFFGGGISEWHSVPPTTTATARSMLEYRYGESASNWETIMSGFLIGGIVFLSGVLAILVDMVV